MSRPTNEAEAFFRGEDHIHVGAQKVSGASLVRLPIAKLLTLFFGIMSCADRRPGGRSPPNADSRVMPPRLLRPLRHGTLSA